MWKVRELADKMTNVVMNYTEIESKVREATNDEAWGPHGTIKHELSQATYSYDQFPEVMGMLWKRIAENKKSPRRIYKSLVLLHHLLLHGSDRVVRAAQDRLYEIRALQDYHVVYEAGFTLDAIIPPSGTETKDGELNVRVKAKELVDLVQDDDKLREERKKARKNRDKYVGIGSDKMMTSKWDSTGDYGGGYDDDFAPKKSRSPSPTLGKFSSGFKPYTDAEPEFKKVSVANSNYFNNNHSSKSKPAPPSPSFEVSDDFNPRADEKASDFGDFASASVTATKAVVFPAVGSLGSNDGGDFADFQSAFGSSKSEEPTVPVAKADDLLGLSLDLGGGGSKISSNNDALFSEDLFSNSAVPMNFPTTNNSVGFASFGSPVTSSMPSPLRQVGMGQMSPGFTPQSSQPANMMNFGGNNLLTPVLEPAKSGSNVNNTSAANNNNNPKPSLKGTTWSDLNISIDDLNLGRSNTKTAQGNKTPMNQLKPNNTSNGGLF